MKLVKTMFCNRMEDEFLIDSLVVHIERDIVENFDFDSIIDDFKSLNDEHYFEIDYLLFINYLQVFVTFFFQIIEYYII